MINKAKIGKCTPHDRLWPVCLRRGRRKGSRNSSCCNGGVKRRLEWRKAIYKNLGADDIEKFRGKIACSWRHKKYEQ